MVVTTSKRNSKTAPIQREYAETQTASLRKKMTYCQTAAKLHALPSLWNCEHLILYAMIGVIPASQLKFDEIARLKLYTVLVNAYPRRQPRIPMLLASLRQQVLRANQEIARRGLAP